MSLKQATKLGKQFQNPVPTTTGGFSVIFKVAPRMIFRGPAGSPNRPPGPFHTDPNIFATAPRSGLRITWMGHSTSLIEIDGIRLIIDPVWEQRAGPVNWAGPKRFFAPTITLQDLPPIDAVIISHDHYDHLGAQTARTLAALPQLQSARWITALGVDKILHSVGVAPARISALDWTGNATIGAVKITALPARHFSGRSLFNRFETLWASFALIGPHHSVYYGADSGEWDGFVEIGKQFGPFDLSMLEIGASDPLWPDVHMGPEGAVRSFRALGGHGHLMPIHWGLFDLAFHPWTQPIESVFAVKDLSLWSPTPGTPSEFVPGIELRSNWWR
jgi:L-ascorbate metabolism protein UlaG (beta-lactamase superfamily)